MVSRLIVSHTIIIIIFIINNLLFARDKMTVMIALRAAQRALEGGDLDEAKDLFIQTLLDAAHTLRNGDDPSSSSSSSSSSSFSAYDRESKATGGLSLLHLRHAHAPFPHNPPSSSSSLLRCLDQCVTGLLRIGGENVQETLRTLQGAMKTKVTLPILLEALDRVIVLLLSEKRKKEEEEEEEEENNNNNNNSNDDSSSYDSDGVRVVTENSVWGRGSVRTERLAWMRLPLPRKLSWRQSRSDIEILLTLPSSTQVTDLRVDVQTRTIRIGLAWFGIVLEGTLYRSCKSSDALWTLEDDNDDNDNDDDNDDGSDHHHHHQRRRLRLLRLLLPKGDPRQTWKSLMELPLLEKGHVEILKEMVADDDGYQDYADLDDEARSVLHQLQDREELYRTGVMDLQHSFDDFRLVLGDDDEQSTDDFV